MLKEPWKTWLRTAKIVAISNSDCLISLHKDSLKVATSLEGAVELLNAVRKTNQSITSIVPIEDSYIESLLKTNLSLHKIH